jgi:hypothetical protein
MDFPKTKKVLNQFAKAVIKSGKARLSASKMGNSRLIKNFGYHLDQIKSGDLLTFTFGGSAKYWQFVDEGVRGSGGYKGSGKARGGKSPFKFKKKNIAKGVIDRWIVRKGLKAARDKEGRFIKRKGLAFVIGRAIAQRGLTRTQFFSAPYKKNMKYYINKIAVAYALDTVDNIEKKLNTDK